MGYFRKCSACLPFHITELDEFVSNFATGNLASASKRAYRILDRSCNGPLENGTMPPEPLTSIDEGIANKLKASHAKISELLNHHEMKVGREKASSVFDDDEETEEHETKKAKKGKKAAPAPTPTTLGEAGLTVSNEPDVEAVPWVLFVELGYMVLRVIEEYQPKEPVPAK